MHWDSKSRQDLSGPLTGAVEIGPWAAMPVSVGNWAGWEGPVPGKGRARHSKGGNDHPPSPEESLLAEIRDLLKERR